MGHELRDGSFHALFFGDKAMFVHPVVVYKFGDVVTDVVKADNNASLTFPDVVFLVQ